MDKPFFPIKGEQVVPLIKIDDNDEVTRVQTSNEASLEESPKLKIIRIAFASLFKLTIVDIDPNGRKTKR
jgi:hypothetical protein